jgi:N-acetylneuraminic acid mutarotase
VITDLPTPVTNNAVAWRQSDSESWAYSFLGLGSSKRFDGITNACFAFSNRFNQWASLPKLDDAGRIAATSQCVGDRLYVFGGYTVEADGSEHTSSIVNIYDPRTSEWGRGAAIPVPVDDTVSAAYLDRYVYLISGWSETKNVNNVQLYDAQADRWAQATAIPGAAFLATVDRSSAEIFTASTGFPMLATSSQCPAAAGWERLIRQILAQSLGHNCRLIRTSRVTVQRPAPWRTLSLFVEGLAIRTIMMVSGIMVSHQYRRKAF